MKMKHQLIIFKHFEEWLGCLALLGISNNVMLLLAGFPGKQVDTHLSYLRVTWTFLKLLLCIFLQK